MKYKGKLIMSFLAVLLGGLGIADVVRKNKEDRDFEREVGVEE